MYNRYIPQPDGTYKRNRIAEPIREPQKTPSPPPPPRQEPQECPKETPICQENTEKNHPVQATPCCNQNAGRFLRQLLPRDFDTGDLMVILLLLLIAGDCPAERGNALLTLALYFIM